MLAGLVLCAAILCGCGGESRAVSGIVTEIQTGDGGALTALVICTDTGEELGMLIGEETIASPPGGGGGTTQSLLAGFQEALRVDDSVESRYGGRKQMLTTASGEKIAAYEASHLRITGTLLRGAVTMPDGTALDLLDLGATRRYRAADGTELLCVRDPENRFAENIGALGEAAQEKIVAWYGARGPLYDEGAALEKVYALYRKLGEAFAPGLAYQSIYMSAESERAVYLLTAVTTPTGEENGNLLHETDLCDAFDKQTGERLGIWELFTVPKEKVMRAVLDANGIDDETLRAEMAAADWDGHTVFYGDSLMVEFGPGVLPSQPEGFWLTADYENGIGELMYDWARPVRKG